jgi:hypothetical protein
MRVCTRDSFHETRRDEMKSRNMKFLVLVLMRVNRRQDRIGDMVSYLLFAGTGRRL